jgi:lysophospholipase L1-like esterase
MKRLAIAYIILLHLVLVGVLWKSDFLDLASRRILGKDARPEISEHYHGTLRYHARSVDVVPDGSVIFIGDSLTEGLAVAAVHPLSINYGIGGDTTRGVLDRLPTYMPALVRAKCIVLAIGFNDFRYRSPDDAVQNCIRILDALPKGRRVVVSAILPIDESARAELAERKDWIQRFNTELRRVAEERDAAIFVDSSHELDADGDGRLDPSLHDGDGVHLNSAGNLRWASRLRDAVLRQGTEEP